MKYVTIDQWIKYKGQGILYAQIVTCDKYSFNIKSQIMDMQDLKEYYNNRDIDDVFEYRIDDDRLLVSDRNSIISEFPDDIAIEKRAFTLTGINNSIYSLFNNLMDDGAYFVSKEGLDDLDNIENYIIEFIPKYSASSMTIYISMQINLYWKSIKLIYAEGDKMKYNNFYFRIPKSVKNKYHYEIISEIKIHDKEFVVMKYNGENPLYVYDPNNVTLFNSLINRRTFLSAQLKNYINAVSFVRRLVCKEMLPVEYRNSKSIQNMAIFNGKVTFTSSAKTIKKDEFMAILEDIMINFKEFYETNPNPDELKKYIIDKVGTGILYNIYIILSTIYIETQCFNDVGAVFNLCTDTILKYEIQKAKVDATIYAFRINYFSFQTPYIDKYGHITGGGIPAYTKFNRDLGGY